MTKRMTEEDIIKVFNDYGYEVLEIHEVQFLVTKRVLKKDSFTMQ